MNLERLQIKAMAEHYFEIYRKNGRTNCSWETFFSAFEIGLASGLEIASFTGTDSETKKTLADLAVSIKYFNKWKK